MKTQIVGENIKINERIRELINDKLATDLEKYLKHFNEDMKKADVRIIKKKDWGYKVNFDMWLPGKKHIFAETTHENLSSAIVDLREELEEQIKKYKDKLSNK